MKPTKKKRPLYRFMLNLQKEQIEDVLNDFRFSRLKETIINLRLTYDYHAELWDRLEIGF